MNIRAKTSFIIIILFILISGGGCSSLQHKSSNSLASKSTLSQAENDKNIEDGFPSIQIKEFMLSPGDEISITVLGYNELGRKLIIPPGGRFFFPMVGEIDVNGKTLSQLRKFITDGLSKYKETAVSPGDEIAVTVFRNNELNRRLIIPPGNSFFYPFAGEIDTSDKTTAQLQEIITVKLSKFMVDPQVSVDIVAYGRPKIIVDPQVSIEVVGLGGQKIFVLGEVKRPGVFAVEGETDIVEAISKAGGFTLDARQTNVLLIRGDINKPELALINIEKFLKGADLSQNIQLQRGDIVYVPASIIANVDRFFKHFENIIRPIVLLEQGIVLSPRVEDVFKGTRDSNSTPPLVITPP